MGETSLGSSNMEKDLDVLVDHNLNVCDVAPKKANVLLGWISRGIKSKSKILIPLYTALDTSGLKYCTQF